MKRISRILSLVLVRAASLLLLTPQAAIVLAQSESTPPPFPPPGKLVDVGGWRLHLNCTGEPRASQPTVILEPGVGDFSVEWSLVQPGVAKFARVCSYDRAGDGWSELGPHPRTFRQIVYELHTLLDKAGVKPPLVLVGHSYGGWLVRLYASTYPAEVAGMVLVEAGADNPRRFLPNGKLGYSSDLVKNREIPAVKTSGPLRISDIPPDALKQMMSGARSLAKNPNPPPRDKLPPDAQRMRTWAVAQVGHVAAAVNPFEHEELALLRAERTKTTHPLGDMPLIVLTRGISDEHGPDGKALEEEHRQAHVAIAAMSRNGKLVVAAHSGHHVQLDEPELVIKSIREVLAAVQAGRPEQIKRVEPDRIDLLGGQRAGTVRLIYDQAHGEEPPPGPMDAIAKKLGLEIQTSVRPINAEALNGVRILYLRAPTKEFAAAEREAIVAFVKRGGSLFLVMDEERRQSVEKTGVNSLITPFGLRLTPDTEYLHNCGGMAKAGEINKADREVPFSGGRAVEGGTAFAFQLDKEGKPAQPFGAYKRLDHGARIVVLGEGMATLFLGTPNGVRLTGVPKDPTRTTYWGKDSAIFMEELLMWLSR